MVVSEYIFQTKGIYTVFVHAQYIYKKCITGLGGVITMLNGHFHILSPASILFYILGFNKVRRKEKKCNYCNYDFYTPNNDEINPMSTKGLIRQISDYCQAVLDIMWDMLTVYKTYN